MRVRTVFAAAAAAGALAAPNAFAGTPAAAPQVIDPAGDANFINSGGEPVPVSGDHATPVGSQGYADVVSVTWTRTTVKKGKKIVFTGFTVTAAMSAPPTPPAGTALVYRMLGVVGGDAAAYLGPVYYTSATPGTPQSALRDDLADTTAGARLTPLALPVIAGNTMTWTVPASVLPKQFKVGSTLTNLYFEVRELESFQGQTAPSALPVLGGATGLAVGILDNGSSTGSFKIG